MWTWPFPRAPLIPLFKLLFLTAQRRDEVGKMAEVELDLAKQLWTIPQMRQEPPGKCLARG